MEGFIAGFLAWGGLLILCINEAQSFPPPLYETPRAELLENCTLDCDNDAVNGRMGGLDVHVVM